MKNHNDNDSITSKVRRLDEGENLFFFPVTDGILSASYFKNRKTLRSAYRNLGTPPTHYPALVLRYHTDGLGRENN